MVITSKGTVLLFCEGRKNSRRDHGDVDLIMTRSMDGGRTWSEHKLIPVSYTHLTLPTSDLV